MIRVIGKCLRWATWATIQLVLIGICMYFVFRSASAKPAVKPGVEAQHQWDVASFWLPLVFVGGLLIVGGLGYLASSHHTSARSGTILVAALVAGVAVSINQFWPQDVAITSAGSGIAVGFLILCMYGIMYAGRKWLAPRLHV